MSTGAPPADPASTPSPAPGPTPAVTSRGARSVAPAVLVLAWSSGFVGAALAAPRAPAPTTLAWRMLLTAALLLAVVAVRHRRVERRAVARHAVLGLPMQVVYLGGVFGAASAGVAAGTIALVAATQPLVVLALSRPLLGTTARPVQVVALVVGVLGVGAVVAGDVADGDVADGSAPWWALALPVVATLGLATGTVLEQRWAPRCSLLDALTVQATTAALALCAVAAATGTLRPPLTAGFGLAVVWTVVLSGLGGYGAYLLTLRLMGSAAVSALLLLTPPVTALWVWAMLGQTPSPLVLPGGLLCAGAVLVALRAGGRPADPAPHPCR